MVAAPSLNPSTANRDMKLLQLLQCLCMTYDETSELPCCLYATAGWVKPFVRSSRTCSTTHFAQNMHACTLR